MTRELHGPHGTNPRMRDAHKEVPPAPAAALPKPEGGRRVDEERS